MRSKPLIHSSASGSEPLSKVGGLYLQNCSTTEVAPGTNEDAFCGSGAWFCLLNSYIAHNKSRIKFM